jgi:DnaK suppressor protein
MRARTIKPSARLDDVRERLLDRRQDLLNNIKGKLEASQMRPNPAGPGDESDVAIHSFDQETSFSFAEIGSVELERIDDALTKIAEGRYGKCVSCGTSIPAKRLSVMPFATFCVKCQEEEEKVEAVKPAAEADDETVSSWSRIDEIPQDTPDRDRYLEDLQRDWEAE